MPQHWKTLVVFETKNGTIMFYQKGNIIAIPANTGYSNKSLTNVLYEYR